MTSPVAFDGKPATIIEVVEWFYEAKGETEQFCAGLALACY